MALAAALLMVFVPALSRLMASASPQLLSGLTELCTVSGLKLVDLSGVEDLKGALPADGQMADCPYCVLLGPVALTLLALATLLFPRAANAPLAALYRLVRIVGPPPRGLGSRGPPI